MAPRNLQGTTKYNQHRQNYLNNYFRAKVGKELPEQFPESFPVSKQNIGNSHFHTLQRHEKPEITKKTIQGGSKAVIYYLINWSAANGGLRGVWLPLLEIGQNRPFSPFFFLFRPFLEGAKSTWEFQKMEENGLFPQISSGLLKPPFTALQINC